ncbi:MAG: hypothetical protein R3E04_05630 [Sphingobium sp.]
MPFRAKLLMDFRQTYDRLEAARQEAASATPYDRDDVTAKVIHAERNFIMTAEILARMVPRIVEGLPVDPSVETRQSA